MVFYLTKKEVIMKKVLIKSALTGALFFSSINANALGLLLCSQGINNQVFISCMSKKGTYEDGIPIPKPTQPNQKICMSLRLPWLLIAEKFGQSTNCIFYNGERNKSHEMGSANLIISHFNMMGEITNPKPTKGYKNPIIVPGPNQVASDITVTLEPKKTS